MGVAVATVPPTIPACVAAGDHTRSALLLWAHTGRSWAELATGERFALTGGEAIWLPSDVERRFGTDAGSVALPLWVPEDPPANEPTRIPVRDEWNLWLISHFMRAVVPFTSPRGDPADILELLRRSPRTPATNSGAALPELPALPTTAAALTIARQLIHEPDLCHTLDEWSRVVACSTRTLQRAFLRETGLSFAQWRQRVRLTAAAEFLEAGYPIGDVAARTGFGSRNGFTRAFRVLSGVTPQQYAIRSTSMATSSRVGAAQGTASLGRALRSATLGALAPEQRDIPATWIAPHTNQHHVLAWMLHGTGAVNANGRTYRRSRGQVTWIPAGIEHETTTHPGSVSLAVADLPPDHGVFTTPRSVQFTALWDTYLLWSAVAARTRLRPAAYRADALVTPFSDHLTAERALVVQLPRDACARAAAVEFLKRLGTTGESLTLDVPDPVHTAFRRELGLTFAQWRRTARMRIARDLLSAGAPPSSVATRVGYSQVTNFSRSFSLFHGLSPREYQAQHSSRAR